MISRPAFSLLALLLLPAAAQETSANLKQTLADLDRRCLELTKRAVTAEHEKQTASAEAALEALRWAQTAKPQALADRIAKAEAELALLRKKAPPATKPAPPPAKPESR